MTSPVAPTTAPVTASSPQMMGRDYALITLQSMLWGSAFFFVALAGETVPPLTMTALRLVPACLILFLVIRAFGLRLPATREFWAKMLVMAAFNNVIPFVLIIMAQRDVTGGVAAIFNATAPLFAVVFAAWFVPEERFSWHRVVGIAAGIAGVAVLVGDAASGVGPTAAGLLLFAASCYAGANVMTRLFFPGYAPFVIACAQMFASLLIALSASLLVEQPWTLPWPATPTWLAIACMGIFGSAFASLCHFTVLRRAGPTNAMLVTIILPLTPLLLGRVVFGDVITPRHIIGGLLIALALLIIDGRLARRLSRQRASKAVS